MVLEHFDVTNEQYAVVFTANATHALQLVADCFIFGEKSSSALRIGSVTQDAGPTFAYMRDSHNSVVGMREIVKERVNNILCLDNFEHQLLLQNGDHRGLTHTEQGLFAMTAMSNFCGRKYNLSAVGDLQQRGWSICLDAASLVSSSPLSLAEVRPHFVAISFYKMFGYPTGLGALLIRRMLPIV
ncbi:hypothetical protein ANCDUO_17557 [Ancylostoma duodenale]|uniref:Aminotransferase class V domain-containing protein n=1 Tax=Ancylostoma duodenale TaxID=51022 RepID=A0A0C2CRA3_9BILA|nr:hypothetical protein ANCDUO_17557 [Ancylostoma duodenale]